MDSNFQTSFIPKKPIIEDRVTSSRPVGLFMIVALFIFFTVLVSSVGLYFYDNILKGNLAKMQNDLSLAKNRFEPERINELQILDKRLSASSDILSKHVAVSPIFEILQNLTMKTVRYTKFTYEIQEEKGTQIHVKMNGVAVGYRSIALQSDLFSKNKSLIDPVFSNLTLDDKGNVAFQLDFNVDPALVNYKHALQVGSVGDVGNTVPPTN
jgi:hypothetical protein